jgi:hypothetical protein
MHVVVMVRLRLHGSTLKHGVFGCEWLPLQDGQLLLLDIVDMTSIVICFEKFLLHQNYDKMSANTLD